MDKVEYLETYDKDKDHVVSRKSYTGGEEWLILIKTTYTTHIPGKKFPEHGNLVNTNQAGNGYHGNCSNCGLALVTDLGYMSWDNTVCEIEEKTIVKEETSYRWTKFLNRCSKFTNKEANSHFRQLLFNQGWGKYNFFVRDIVKNPVSQSVLV